MEAHTTKCDCMDCRQNRMESKYKLEEEERLKEAAKSCLGCTYADWKRTKNGGLHPSGDGRCTYHYSIPELPAAFFWAHRINPAPFGGNIDRRMKPRETVCKYYVDL